MSTRTFFRLIFYFIVLGCGAYLIFEVVPTIYTIPSTISRIYNQGRSSQVLPGPLDTTPKVADRNLDNLTPETKRLAKEFLIEAEKQGYHLLITEGRRSQERQQLLYDQGRSQPGTIVTWTMNSKHLRGIAFDVAFQPDYHGTTYPANQELRTSIGEIGESMGLTRGGRRRRPDKPHFQNGW